MSGVQGYTEADLRRLKSVAVRPRGWSHRVKPLVREYRDTLTGHWIKVIKTTGGHKIRMRWEGQDANISLPHVRIDPWTGISEERM